MDDLEKSAMSGWAQIQAVADHLRRFPERLAPFRRKRSSGSATHSEIEVGFDVVRRGLAILGPAAPDEPSYERFPGLPGLCGDCADEIQDLRKVSGPALEALFEGRRPELEHDYLSHGVSLLGIARFFLRESLGTAAGDLIAESPAFYCPDPEGLRDLGLQWLEANALLLSESDLSACLYLMVNRDATGLIPVATRLYHNPAIGPEVRETIEEIFVPEVVEQIRAAAPS